MRRCGPGRPLASSRSGAPGFRLPLNGSPRRSRASVGLPPRRRVNTSMVSDHFDVLVPVAPFRQHALDFCAWSEMFHTASRRTVGEWPSAPLTVSRGLARRQTTIPRCDAVSFADVLTAVVPFVAVWNDGIGRACFVRALPWLMHARGRHAFGEPFVGGGVSRRERRSEGAQR
jgi:hypothetical protein